MLLSVHQAKSSNGLHKLDIFNTKLLIMPLLSVLFNHHCLYKVIITHSLSLPPFLSHILKLFPLPSPYKQRYLMVI